MGRRCLNCDIVILPKTVPVMFLILPCLAFAYNPLVSLFSHSSSEVAT